MSSEIRVREAGDARSRRAFLDLPFRLYRGDPNWVAPLRGAQAKMFEGRTAFHRHAETALFLAERGGAPVGRIMAIHNHAHADRYKDGLGFFGFFECAQDREAAAGLFEEAGKWLKGKGLSRVRGPVNPSMNQECGLLIDGFDRPPVALMPYNPAYYAGLLEGVGLAKCNDLFAYLLERKDWGDDSEQRKRLIRTGELLRRRHPEVHARPLNLRNYEEELFRYLGVFEEARRNNWGYVPVTREEVLETAKELRPVADAEIIILADVDGEPAGASLALPDVNQALAKLRGSLFSWRLPGFLWKLRRMDGMRIFGIAALEKYRHLGITAMLFAETLQRGWVRGYQVLEASWVAETNLMSNRTIEQVANPRKYKTYRVYEMALGAGARGEPAGPREEPAS
ncbi:MAG: N-acetyltransferase [Planctomycetes bacterium]|nr:N-acetyltransferase [Planctomycetota bacterium]